jgi:hypothetical protein
MSVDIRNVIHQKLYDRAWQEASSRAKRLQCEEGCPKHTWVVSRESRCDPNAQIGRPITNTARTERQIISTVTVGVTCRKNTDETPPETGVTGPVPAGQFKHPYPPSAQEPLISPVSEWSETLGKGVGENVTCGTTEVILVEYVEPANGCDKAKVDSPNLEGAKTFAEAYYDRISCDRQCTKSAFKIDYVEWHCDSVFTGGNLLIRVFFTVTCSE